MTPFEQYHVNLANTLAKQFEKRNMEFTYCATGEEAKAKVLSMLQENDTISFGGSMTISQIGLLSELRDSGKYNLIDRSKASSPEEVRKMYLDSFDADAYLMSSNAITLDGELVNIDGNGNRVAALIYGPKKVFVIAGINKLATDEADAVRRVRNMAAPPNGTRLNTKTPCSSTGVCHDCLSPDCMCCHMVITRYSRIKERIHVILIGESYGY